MASLAIFVEDISLDTVLHCLIYFLTALYKMGIGLNSVPQGTSLVVQPLRLHTSRQGVRVQFLVRELRFHMPQRTAKSFS